MAYKVALAGNPNSGKTTLFNDLTGSNQYVGNWPGVTVEKKEGKLRGYDDVDIQDLPGIYSLSPYTPEEVVAREYLVHQEPDAIIDIVDASNIERNLYLTTQLLELGVPMVVSLNMMDIVTRAGDRIDTEKLSKMLKCDVMEITASRGIGSMDVAERASVYVRERPELDLPHIFDGSVEHALAHIEESIEGIVAHEHLRWYAIKLFERDERVIKELKLTGEFLSHIEKHIKDCEREMDDDAESIIASQRYDFVTKVVEACVKKKNRGIKMNLSDKIDRVVTSRYLGLPIFIGIMFLVYFIAITSVGTLVTDFMNDTLFGDLICGNVSAAMEAADVAPWLTGLVVDGILTGVGAVLSFVPQMLILFLLLSLLEDIGYMSRVAFIMDRIFKKFGLSGKSFIPLLVASGCGVPGIMASRTIEQDTDRRMTIMTTCFVPCGAKMPVIGLVAGAVFGGAWWVAPLAYFIGVASVVVSGIILKKFKVFSGKPTPFVMELPMYHRPLAKNILKTTWDRGWSFIKKAFTVILVSSVVIWFFCSFAVTENGLEMVSLENSMLAAAGTFVAPVFAPLGFGTWEASVSTLTGFAAKENLVSTLGIVYGCGGADMWPMFAGSFTAAGALSYMMFNILCAPCVAAMSTIRGEMRSGKWTAAAIGYMTAYAYAVALIINQVGCLFTGDAGIATIAAGVVLGIIVFLLLRRSRYADGFSGRTAV